MGSYYATLKAAPVTLLILNAILWSQGSQHSHPRIYCGLNLSSLDIAIASLKLAPLPSLQTRDGGVFDTITRRLI